MSILQTSYASRLQPLKATLGVLALGLLALVAPAAAAPGNDQRAPDLGDCQKLKAPEGNKVALHVLGVGVQIYRWNGTSWNFVAPEAVLYANAGANGEVGIHFGGPTWQSNSGSKVVGTVVDFCIADTDAIPWLLLKSVPELTEGPGIFGQVTYIQRLNTVGGKAPTVPGDFLGQVARIPYTADYYFYRKHK